MAFFLLVLPIALTIFCGYLLVRLNVMSSKDWNGIETLSFQLLIPAVLIKYIALSQLSLSQVAPLLSAVIISMLLAGLMVLSLRQLRSFEQLSNPTLTTLFQTSIRWNAFISLIAVELFIGVEAVVYIAVAMAVLVPLVNVTNVIVLSAYGSAKTSVSSILLMVIKNPLVIACFIGIAINVSSYNLPEPLIKTLDLIGAAAIAIGLLTVGAGIKAKRLFNISINLWAGISIRLIVLPVLFLGLAKLMALDQTETLIGVLILAVPTASNGYIVAKKMGGNAELFSDILAWQVLLSLFLLPVYVTYLMG